jgi:pyruvate/2-oxoglutarate/acetoin dehydrogenase E1 component
LIGRISVPGAPLSNGRTAPSLSTKVGRAAASRRITARIVEGAFYNLDAPVARVCSAEVPMPHAKHLEEAALPQVDAIVATAQRVATGSQ